MSKSGNKSKFSAVRFLGCVVLPLIAGALLGVAGAYFLRTELIDNIEGETLSTVDIEYGHPITLDCFFAKIRLFRDRYCADVSFKQLDVFLWLYGKTHNLYVLFYN